jgi:hypothetical protein
MQIKPKPLKIKIKQPTPTAAERLYAKHQAIRKEKGLPDPSEYKKKLDDMKEETELNEMDKSAPQPGRDGNVSHRTYGSRDTTGERGKESEGKTIKAKKAVKDALGIMKKIRAEQVEHIDEQLEKKGRFVSGPPKKTFKAPTIVSPIKEAKDTREYDYEGDMAMSQLRSLVFNAEDLIEMMDENTNLPEWVQSKITLAEDYISTAANYLRGELTEAANPAQQAAIAINMKKKGIKPKNEEVEYLEEKNAPTNPELWSRAKALARSKFDVYPSAYANGWAAKWYKSKGGGWKTVSEEAEEPSMAARTLSRKAQIVKDAAKSKKVDKEEASDKFQKDPELSSDIQKT